MEIKNLECEVASLRARAENALPELFQGVSHMLLHRAVFAKAYSDEEEEILAKQILSLSSEFYQPEKKRELLRLHQIFQQQPVDYSLFTESLYKAEEIAESLDETVNQLNQRFQELRKTLDQQQISEAFRSVSRLPDDDFDLSVPPHVGFEETLEAISVKLKKEKEEQDKPLTDLKRLLDLLSETISFSSVLIQSAKTAG